MPCAASRSATCRMERWLRVYSGPSALHSTATQSRAGAPFASWYQPKQVLCASGKYIGSRRTRTSTELMTQAACCTHGKPLANVKRLDVGFEPGDGCGLRKKDNSLFLVGGEMKVIVVRQEACGREAHGLQKHRTAQADGDLAFVPIRARAYACGGLRRKAKPERKVEVFREHLAVARSAEAREHKVVLRRAEAIGVGAVGKIAEKVVTLQRGRAVRRHADHPARGGGAHASLAV